MTVRFIKPQNRLAWRAGKKGLSRSQAVFQAGVNINTIREPTIAYIDENIDALHELFGVALTTREPPMQALYDASNAIAGTAALFGLDALGKGAFSLCEVLAYLEDSGRWSAPAVKVHLEGLRLMRQLQPGSGDEAAAMILDNLAALLAHISASGTRSDEGRNVSASAG
jgi:hypothetical protein